MIRKILLLCDSGKCVYIANINFLWNMENYSGQREICIGMSGHHSNTKFLTYVHIFELHFDKELIQKLQMELIIMHSSSQSMINIFSGSHG
jgi:hypothetical protein